MIRLLQTTVVTPSSAWRAKEKILNGELKPEDSEEDYVIVDKEQLEFLKKKTTLRMALLFQKTKSRFDDYRTWLAESGKNGYIGLDWNERLETKRFWRIFTGNTVKQPKFLRNESFESRSSLNSVRGKFRKELLLN